MNDTDGNILLEKWDYNDEDKYYRNNVTFLHNDLRLSIVLVFQ